jgi:hypothetical protein
MFQGQRTVTVIAALDSAMRRAAALLSELTAETKSMASRKDERMDLSIWIVKIGS